MGAILEKINNLIVHQYGLRRLFFLILSVVNIKAKLESGDLKEVLKIRLVLKTKNIIFTARRKIIFKFNYLIMVNKLFYFIVYVNKHL